MAHTHTSIWKISLNLYRVHVTSKTLKDQILAWPECRLHCIYLDRDFRVIAWDLLVPASRCRDVARLCRISLRKELRTSPHHRRNHE